MKSTRSTHRTRSPLLRIIALPLLALGIALTLAVAGSSPAAANDPLGELLIPYELEQGRSAPSLRSNTGWVNEYDGQGRPVRVQYTDPTWNDDWNRSQFWNITPPMVTSASLDSTGTIIIVSFTTTFQVEGDDPLNGGTVATDWTYALDGVNQGNVHHASLRNNTVELDLDTAVPSGWKVTVSYRMPRSEPRHRRLRDSSPRMNPVESFTNLRVTNNSNVRPPLITEFDDKSKVGKRYTTGNSVSPVGQGETCHREANPGLLNNFGENNAWFCDTSTGTNKGWVLGSHQWRDRNGKLCAGPNNRGLCNAHEGDEGDLVAQTSGSPCPTGKRYDSQSRECVPGTDYIVP